MERRGKILAHIERGANSVTDLKRDEFLYRANSRDDKRICENTSGGYGNGNGDILDKR